jgi:hypothetical protein
MPGFAKLLIVFRLATLAQNRLLVAAFCQTNFLNHSSACSTTNFSTLLFVKVTVSPLLINPKIQLRFVLYDEENWYLESTELHANKIG